MVGTVAMHLALTAGTITRVPVAALIANLIMAATISLSGLASTAGAAVEHITIVYGAGGTAANGGAVACANMVADKGQVFCVFRFEPPQRIRLKP